MPELGEMKTFDGVLKYWDGSEWVEIGSPSGPNGPVAPAEEAPDPEETGGW